MVLREGVSWMKDWFIVDGHCDTLLDIADGKRCFDGSTAGGHLDLPRLQQGGVRLQFFAAFIGSEYKPERALKRALFLVNAFHQMVEHHPVLTHITHGSDIEELFSTDKIGALLAIEGGEALAGSVELLELYHRLGLRSLTLTWNQRNELADGVGEGNNAGGLTKFGKRVIQQMNRLGMLVDVSHLSDAGFWDVLQVSTEPIIASHSNCRALCNHRRNLTDDQIKALAQADGVMGVTLAGDFIHEYTPSLNRLVDHIEHVVQLVGIEHVGLGSDFDGVDRLPPEIPDVSALPRLTEVLQSRGFTPEHIQAILGGNLLRILRQVLPK